jgi:cohesin complex subunit SA-1/2
MYRDVAPEIREVVISGIGNWVAEDPDAFLIDYYLKYLAWALSDRHEAVRLAAVRSIHRLYTSE